MTEEEFILSQYNPNTTTTLTTTETDTDTLNESEIVRKNNEIIRYADQNIIERLKYGDASLKLSEITQAKQAAFQQNAKILGLDEPEQQLIPATINIQIINN